MHQAWVHFASTGDAGWQPFNSRYPVQVFDGEGPWLVLDPRGDERKAW
jgi:para-nitrobenzyl esterase